MNDCLSVLNIEKRSLFKRIHKLNDITQTRTPRCLGSSNRYLWDL